MLGEWYVHTWELCQMSGEDAYMIRPGVYYIPRCACIWINLWSLEAWSDDGPGWDYAWTVARNAQTFILEKSLPLMTVCMRRKR
jgi:hypothetical protein